MNAEAVGACEADPHLGLSQNGFIDTRSILRLRAKHRRGARSEGRDVLGVAEVLKMAERAKETVAVARERKIAAKNQPLRKRVKNEAPPLVEKAPQSNRITAYDEAHFAIYLRLLDAKSKSAGDDAMLDIILEASPRMSRDKARHALQNHLKRAIWMSEEGYRDLLGGKLRRSK